MRDERKNGKNAGHTRAGREAEARQVLAQTEKFATSDRARKKVRS